MWLPAIRKKTLVGKTFWLDFANFEDCKLVDCRFIFFGIGGFRADGCHFINPIFKLVGPARTAVNVYNVLKENGVRD